jgi:uncharacterized protein YdeI (YjbR/CyaY-like superfamily)
MDGPSAEFNSVLKAAGLENFFAACTPAHRREYLKWIGEAKKAPTRAARIKKALQMLAKKQKAEAKPAHQ